MISKKVEVCNDCLLDDLNYMCDMYEELYAEHMIQKTKIAKLPKFVRKLLKLD